MASLSTRGRDAAAPNGNKFLWDVLGDLWNPDTNPSGYVSLAMAENVLMQTQLISRLKADFEPSPRLLTYGDGTTGSNRLKSAISRLLTTQLKPVLAIDSAHISITNGCCSSLEQLAWALADPGDYFLLGKPYFRAFLSTFGSRMGAGILPVTFGNVDPFGVSAAQRYEEALLDTQRRGQKVKGLILCNPHNPLGRCYPRSTIIQLMELCQKYGLHLISDEIYALSVWGPGPPFHSCLSIDTTNIIDPSFVHIVWGVSKDFGANGFRIGATVSQHNPDIHAAIAFSSIHSSSSSITDDVVARMLENEAWAEAFVSQNRLKLADRFELVMNWAESNQIPVAPGTNAAFFLWIDLGTPFRARHSGLSLEDDVEPVVVKALLKQRLLLAPGEQFGAEQPGWFRLVFSTAEPDLIEGLRRIILALDD